MPKDTAVQPSASQVDRDNAQSCIQPARATSTRGSIAARIAAGLAGIMGWVKQQWRASRRRADQSDDKIGIATRNGQTQTKARTTFADRSTAELHLTMIKPRRSERMDRPFTANDLWVLTDYSGPNDELDDTSDTVQRSTPFRRPDELIQWMMGAASERMMQVCSGCEGKLRCPLCNGANCDDCDGSGRCRICYGRASVSLN